MAKKTTRKPTGKATKQTCELTTDPGKRAAADKQTASVKDALPAGLSQPALRALARAGYTSLDQLAKIDDDALLKLHGLGPKTIDILRAALCRKR